MYIETKTNEFFSLSRHNVMAYLVEQTAKRKRRNKGDFLAPFSTRIQLKKKKNHYYHTLLSQRAHKNNKATFASHPFSGYCYSSKLLFWKIVSTERRRGRILLLCTVCVCELQQSNKSSNFVSALFQPCNLCFCNFQPVLNRI